MIWEILVAATRGPFRKRVCRTHCARPHSCVIEPRSTAKPDSLRGLFDFLRGPFAPDEIRKVLGTTLMHGKEGKPRKARAPRAGKRKQA